RDLLQVEDDVGDILHDSRQRRELMQDTFDLDGGDGRALDRGEQDASERISHRRAEAPFEVLREKRSLGGRQRLRVHFATLRFLKSYAKCQLKFLRFTSNTARRAAARKSAA